MARDYNTPERMQEMLKAIRTTSTMASRNVACPYCRHRAFTVYEGATGYLQTKCSKCRHIVSFNLVSMRRVRPRLRKAAAGGPLQNQ